MIQRDELHRAFDGATQASERRSWKYGQLGRPDGTIAVADRPGFVYVRLSSDANQSVTWARNPNRVPLQLNLPVKMRNEGENLVIIDVDTSAVWEASTGGSSNDYAVTHHTHRIGTGLEYEVEGLRLEPGRVYPASGLTATVNPFRYYHAGAWATYAGTTLSLGPYRPSTTGKHRWAVVTVDPDTNALAVVTGPDEDYATTLTPALLDAIDTDNYIPLAGVRLRNDDTNVESYAKYLDARGWINVGAGDYTDEAAQDAIGDMLQASATITPNYVDATPALSFDVNDNSITFAKMADLATDRLIGRDTAGSGDPEAISVGGGLEFTGSAGIQRSALTGDVTAAAGSNATTIANNAVTLAKLADMNTDRLLGRDTASTGDPEEITVGGGLEFTGSGGIQRSALTGDVTASAGSNATTIANDAVTNAKAANMAQSTIKGRAAGAGTGDPTDLSTAQVATIVFGSTGAYDQANDRMGIGTASPSAKLHIVNAGTAGRDDILIESANPDLEFYETDAAANNRYWRIGANGEVFRIRTVDDANSTANDIMTADRTGITVDAVNFPNGNIFIGNTGTAPQKLTIDGVTRMREAASTRYRMDMRMTGGDGTVTVYDDTGAVYRPYIFEASTIKFLTGTAATNNTFIDASGNLGIGTASPQGKVHAHDGTGGYWFGSKTAVAGTAVTIIPNGTGDVTRGFYVIGFARLSTGATLPISSSAPNGSAVLLDQGFGANQLEIACAADGTLTAQRLVGTATWDLVMLIVWQ